MNYLEELMTIYPFEITYNIEDGCRCGCCRVYTVEAVWDDLESGTGDIMIEAIKDFINKNNL